MAGVAGVVVGVVCGGCWVWGVGGCWGCGCSDGVAVCYVRVMFLGDGGLLGVVCLRWRLLGRSGGRGGGWAGGVEEYTKKNGTIHEARNTTRFEEKIEANEVERKNMMRQAHTQYQKKRESKEQNKGIRL